MIEPHVNPKSLLREEVQVSQYGKVFAVSFALEKGVTPGKVLDALEGKVERQYVEEHLKLDFSQNLEAGKKTLLILDIPSSEKKAAELLGALGLSFFEDKATIFVAAALLHFKRLDDVSSLSKAEKNLVRMLQWDSCGGGVYDITVRANTLLLVPIVTICFSHVILKHQNCGMLYLFVASVVSNYNRT